VTLQIRQISAKKKIQNFVETERGPFTSVDVQRYTGVNISTIRKQLCVLTNEEKIKVLRVEKGRKIYVRRGIRNKAGPGFQPEHVEMFINIIKTHKCKSLREMAQLSGLSRQTVNNYLEAMASVGIVTFDGTYSASSLDNTDQVGSCICPNILTDMRNDVRERLSAHSALISILKKLLRRKDRVINEQRKIALARQIAGLG
jgi:DNA-binding transcriptional regulator YhcF (GntR family)